MSNQESSDEQSIRRVIRRINELWLDKRYDDMEALISEHAVIAPPGYEGRVRGREAYIQSYRDYDQAATKHEFTPGEPQIDIMGDVAVAIYPFRVVYELEGKTYLEAGRDVLVLARTAGKWQVVWRTMQTEPTPQDGGIESG